jgi:hypothetical protein
LSDHLNALLGCEVVLDTAGSVFYLGRLVAHDQSGFLLADADVRNTDEGHASREQYIVESRRDGIRVNRTRVFVLRQTVVSVSALADVVVD